jgi:hypothetical protein
MISTPYLPNELMMIRIERRFNPFQLYSEISSAVLVQLYLIMLKERLDQDFTFYETWSRQAFKIPTWLWGKCVTPPERAGPGLPIHWYGRPGLLSPAYLDCSDPAAISSDSEP